MDAYDANILPDNDPVYDRVARVANRILKANRDLEQLHGKDWTITVVQDDTKNAFVLPVREFVNSLCNTRTEFSCKHIWSNWFSLLSCWTQ